MRITNNMLINNMMNSIMKNAERMDRYQNQLATGKKFIYPSDDPIAAARALKLRTDVSEIEQYSKNASDAMSWLDLTDTALKNLGDVINRVRELTLQAAGVTTPNDKLKIYSEINQLKSQLVEIGNTTYAGRYLFAGFQTDAPPISVESMEIPAGEHADRVMYNGRYLNLGGAMKLGSGTAQITGASITAALPVTVMAGVNDSFRLKLDKTEYELVLDAGNYATAAELAAEVQEKVDAAFGQDNVKVYATGLNEIVFETVREQCLELNTGTNDVLADLGHVPAADIPATLTDPVTGALTIFNSKRYMMDGKPILKGGNIQGGVSFTPATPLVIDGTNNSFVLTLDGGAPQLITLTNKTYDGTTGNQFTDLVADIQAQLDTAFGAAPRRVLVDADPVKQRINFISLENETIKINEEPGNNGIAVLGFKDGYTSVANEKQSIEYQIGVANNVKVNNEGNEILGSIEALFDVFNQIEMALQGETHCRLIYDDGTTEVKKLELGNLVEDIDAAFENILGLRADVGARFNYVELTYNRLEEDYISFVKLMSENEDVDMAEVIMKLKNEENIYRASLAGGARIIMPTLVDFLR